MSQNSFRDLVSPGMVIGGCEIVAPLDSGGMGRVWTAVQKSLERKVAVKILPPELARSPDYVQRFQREAKLAARIQSPNVVIVYDAGIENGICFIVMELLTGKSLEDYVHKNGPLSEKAGLQVLAQVARGLAAAHQAGLIHRDVKPANIFLCRKGPTKVLDFGLVQEQSQASGITETGMLMGTPYYMSPEQCDGKRATDKSDLYSLGATMYAALAGRPPFISDSPVQLLRKHVEEVPKPLRERRAELSARTEELIQRLLAKEPRNRPAPAETVAKEAEDALKAITTLTLADPGSPLSGAPDLSDSTPGEGTEMGDPETAKLKKLTNLVFLGAGVLALVLVFLLLVWLLR